MTASAEQLLGRLAVELLRLPGRMGRTAGPWPERPLDPQAWQELRHAAVSGRVTGLLAMGTHLGHLAATSDQAAAAAGAHREAMGVALVLEHLLIDTRRRLLDADGVEPLVLKGPAVAHLDYPDPLWRDFGDIDLLLPASQLATAVAAVVGAGGRRPMPEVRPGWDRRFAKSVTLVDRSGYEVDLHRTIAPGVFGLRVDPVQLFGQPDRFVVGDEVFCCLGPPARLLHACLHVAAGNRVARLSSVVDVAVLGAAALAEREAGRPQWCDELHRLTRQFGEAAAVARAVATVDGRLGVDVHGLVEGLEVTAHDERRLDRYGDGFAGPAIGALDAVPWRRRPAYVRALVWPTAGNLRARGISRRDHLARVVGHVWSDDRRAGGT